jgi:sugar phosphate isomerase/epimerase
MQAASVHTLCVLAAYTREREARMRTTARRQFSLAHLTALECSPPELIRVAADVGYDFVGLRTMPLGLPGEPRYEMAADRRLFRETKAALAETGVRLLDIELARIVAGHDPRSYLPALEAGATLGARHVLTSIWTPDRSFAIDSFGALCELARPLGLIVNLEFVAWASCSTLSGAVDVVRAAACSNAGIMIDTFHFHQSGDRVHDLDSLPPHWFHYAHVSDDAGKAADSLEDCKRRGRDERLFPGEGIIDISGILDHLPDTVVCAIELPHHRRLVELGATGFARRCLEHTMRYLGVEVSQPPSDARMADSRRLGLPGRP